MSAIRLSICIPVHNFGSFLGETLSSILNQLTDDDVEVLVVDGASTDNTSEIVHEFQARHPQLKYYRLSKKGGIDVDMAKSVELAQGDYCWLFGGDDLLAVGAMQEVLKVIQTGYDIYLVRHANYTLDMQLRLNIHPVLDLQDDAEFDLSDQASRARYFSLAQTSEAFFSYMGGIVIKRSKWCSVPLSREFIGSCWAHAARIFELMAAGLSLKYLVASFVNKRGGNDSFLDKGIVNRFRISIDGYHKIAAVFCGADSAEAYHVRRVIRREFPVAKFLYAKMQCERNPKSEDQRLLDALVRKTYCDHSFGEALNKLIYWTAPTWLFSLAWRVYTRLSPKMKRNLVRQS